MLEVATEQNPDSDDTKSAVVQLFSKLHTRDDGPTYIAAISPLLRYGVEQELFNIDFIALFLTDLESDWFSLEDVKELHRLANEMPDDDDRDRLLGVFRPIALGVLGGVIDEEIKDRDVLEGFFDAEKTEEASEKVYNAIADICSEIGIDADSTEITDLQHNVDIDGIIERNVRRASRDGEYDEVERDTVAPTSEIHDLFAMDIPPTI